MNQYNLGGDGWAMRKVLEQTHWLGLLLDGHYRARVIKDSQKKHGGDQWRKS